MPSNGSRRRALRLRPTTLCGARAWELTPADYNPWRAHFGGMRVTLAGTNPGTTYDQILFTGTTAINGALTVELGNSFVPLLGNSFDILDLGTTSGTFSSITLPPLSSGLAWNTSQLYTNGIITVVSAGVPGDYNNNGTVDAADYVLWRKRGALANEVDVPGTVNAADYTEWRARFGNTAGSGAGLGPSGDSSAPVPESNEVALMAIGCAAGVSQLKRMSVANKKTPARAGV